jgi:hypothetical protein
MDDLTTLKAWIIDEAEIYAAPTCLEAMAAYQDDCGEKAHVGELVEGDFLHKEYPLYDDDDNETTETTSIYKLLQRATETCWLATTVQ